eukprot:425370_1
MHLDTILWIFPLRNIGHFNKEVIALFDLFWMEICMYFVWSLVQELKRISGRTQQRATPLKHNMHLDINFWIILGWQQTRWHIRSPFLATNRQSTTLTAFRLSSGSSCAGEVARLQRSELEHWQSNIDVDMTMMALIHLHSSRSPLCTHPTMTMMAHIQVMKESQRRITPHCQRRQ